MQVKICGLTLPEDAAFAADLGATHVGCVLVPGTPRYVDPDSAARVFMGLPEHVRPVLVFRGASIDAVRASCEAAGVRTAQLHGFSEAEARQLEAWGLRVHRVIDAAHLDDLRAMKPTPARPVHVDVNGGGSGQTFSWSRLESVNLTGVFIAGGITPDNVSDLLCLGPHGIDISSGVESSPGIKDPQLLRRLMVAVEAASLGGDGS